MSAWRSLPHDACCFALGPRLFIHGAHSAAVLYLRLQQCYAFHPPRTLLQLDPLSQRNKQGGRSFQGIIQSSLSVRAKKEQRFGY